MRLWLFSKSESHTTLGKIALVLLYTAVGGVEFFFYLVFPWHAFTRWFEVCMLNIVIYFFGALSVYHFIDKPLLTLASRVKKVSLTLKRSRRSGLGGELEEILKEVDRLAETLQRERDGLLETYNEYRSIVESLEEGIIMADSSGEIAMMNSGAEKIFSTKRSEWKGERVNEFFRFYGMIVNNSNEIVTCKKLSKKLLVKETPIELTEKFAALYVFEDVTEVVNLESALGRAENLALLGKMTAVVAHEIKNPIASLKLSVQLLKRQFSEGKSDVTEILNVLDREVRRLEERSRGFLEFSNPKYEMKRIDVISILQEAVKLAKIRAKKENVRIECECPRETITVIGDANALNSAFLNVLVNATDACEKGGNIEVSVKREEKSIVISFRDDGKGLSPEALDYIFEPFFSLKDGGTGLGMSIVKRVVSSHGGKVEVTSKLGKGTVVRIRIPTVGDDVD